MKGGLITCCHYHEKFLKETILMERNEDIFAPISCDLGRRTLSPFYLRIYITVLTKSSVLPSSFLLNRFQVHPVAKLMTLYCLILGIVDQFVC